MLDDLLQELVNLLAEAGWIIVNTEESATIIEAPNGARYALPKKYFPKTKPEKVESIGPKPSEPIDAPSIDPTVTPTVTLHERVEASVEGMCVPAMDAAETLSIVIDVLAELLADVVEPDRDE